MGKKETGKKRVSNGLLPVLLIILLISVAVYLANYFLEWKSTKDEMDSLRELLSSRSESILQSSDSSTSTSDISSLSEKSSSSSEDSLPEEKEEKYVMNENFNKLIKKNKDFVGWLTIPNTNIDFPVVQTKDNDFYLNYGFDKQQNKNGAVFMDFRNRLEPEMHTNTLLYGHNMNSGIMLADLLKYKDVKFYKENPVISFETIAGNEKWKVISAFEANTDTRFGEIFQYYNFVNPKTEEDLRWYLDEITSRSYFNLNTEEIDEITMEDKLLTIQTCANDKYETKICVVARKIRKEEDEYVDTSLAKSNSTRVKAR